MTKITARRLAASVSLTALVPLVSACTSTMPAVTMKVADEQGKPIAGVVAMFWETAREGTWTGHGGRGAVLFVAEDVSDQSGELRFAKQDFDSQPFFLNTNYETPTMLLLKPGYAPLDVINFNTTPTLAEASRWESDGKTVTMKKAPADDSYGSTAYLVKLKTNTMLGFDLGCTWKRVPRTLVMADRMFPDPVGMTSLRALFFNDALYVQRGCGSPKEFFEPYLQ